LEECEKKSEQLEEDKGALEQTKTENDETLASNTQEIEDKNAAILTKEEEKENALVSKETCKTEKTNFIKDLEDMTNRYDKEKTAKEECLAEHALTTTKKDELNIEYDGLVEKVSKCTEELDKEKSDHQNTVDMHEEYRIKIEGDKADVQEKLDVKQAEVDEHTKSNMGELFKMCDEEKTKLNKEKKTCAKN